MNLNSIKFKIGLLYFIITAVILIIMVQGVIYFGKYYSLLYRSFDGEMREKAYELSRTITSFLDALGPERKNFVFAVRRAIRFDGQHPDEGKIAQLENQWREKVGNLGLRQDYVVFSTAKGKPIISSRNTPKELRDLFSKTVGKTSSRLTLRDLSYVEANLNLRIINLPFTYKGQKEPYLIQVASVLPPVVNVLRDRLFHISAGVLFVLLFAGIIGLIFVRRFLKPVMKIAETAKHISRENLSARVNTGRVDQEMRYLADTFNDMISRLEGSFRYISEFSSQVAHELKTPLAIIRGEAELALRKERDTDEYKRVIMTNLEETDRMLKTIENLLLLTKLEYQREAFKFERVDLVEFLNQIYEQGRVLASARGITLDIDMKQKEIIVNADRLHLRRLFFNLIDNAIKFTPENGKIGLSVKYLPNNKVAVCVSDSGAGIPKEELPKIFKRFYRAQNKYSAGVSGSGLGLSIAQSIARIHGGEISVESSLQNGSTFTVTLPLSKS